MATISIQCTNEYNNRMRDYNIFIDGKKVGTIGNGETKDFAVIAGQHKVTAKIDWCSSPDITIDIQEGQTKTLKVGGFKHGNWIMPLAGAIVALHFILKMTTTINYTIFLFLPVFLLLMYYITIGRKKYLTITEVISI